MVRVYFDKRGIVRLSIFWFFLEFVNFLFLRFICIVLEYEGKFELLLGLIGIKSMFSFYLKGIGFVIVYKEESMSLYVLKFGWVVLEIVGKMVE